MLSAELIDRYRAAGARLDARGWAGWPADWAVFRDLALEPVDDLVVSRGDRDEILVWGSRELAHVQGLYVTATRSTFLDMDHDVNLVSVEFSWTWPVGADGVPEFSLAAFGSDSHVLGDPDAQSVSAMTTTFEASEPFRALAQAPTPSGRTFSVV